MDTLEFILNGGETNRFHTIPTLFNQRVDSHSFNVAMLVALMAQDADPKEGEGLSVPLLMAALTHDLSEHKVGDLPAPTKRAMPQVHVEEEEETKLYSFREYWGMMENNHLRAVGLDWEHLLAPKQQRWLKLADAMEGALFCIRERMMGNRLIVTVFGNFRSYIEKLRQINEEPMVQAIITYIDDMWEQADA